MHFKPETSKNPDTPTPPTSGDPFFNRLVSVSHKE